MHSYQICPGLIAKILKTLSFLIAAECLHVIG